MTSCTFCEMIQKKSNLLYENEKIFVMLAPDPAAAGHVIVLPKQHTPILDTVPDFIVGEMFLAAKNAEKGIFEGLSAQGSNLLIQSGQPAGQTSSHAMIHILPRFENDSLHLAWTPKPAPEEALNTFQSKIKDATKSVGNFEMEKPKPVEQKAPEEMKSEDYRMKHLRRVP